MIAGDAIANPGLSLIIPCCDEEQPLPLLAKRLHASLEGLGMSWEVLFVDDGSRDCTFESLAALHRWDNRFKVVALSRNFGQQAAISAGLFYACGNAVGILDADLQDPPELIVRCLRKLQEGYDVVYAVRRGRKENIAKRTAYALFYRLLRLSAEAHIPLDSGDCCVMSRHVAEALRQMPERNIFLRGLRAWAGFRQVGIEYERGPRAAGKTKYPLTKLVRLASDGLFAFSILPLRLAACVGLLTVMLSTAMGLLHLLWRIFGFRLMGHTSAELPGWTTLAVGMFFFGGVQMLMLGIIGEYLGRIYTEVKQRPRWLTRQLLGWEQSEKESTFLNVSHDLPNR